MSVVIPIHKNNDPGDCNNYRPISLTPIISKLFEKVLKNQIYAHFEDNKLFTDSQFGFRQGRSTSDAINVLVNQILKNFEFGFHSIATFYDLTKAFDCVCHELLLQKLVKYNFADSSVRLLQSFIWKIEYSM